MANQLITPVVLCGGTGTRLWPVSRQGYPKQFVALLENNRSLFQETIMRTAQPGFTAPMIVTADDYRFIVKKQLDDIHVGSASLLIEPEAKNTAPAILLAALKAHSNDPTSCLLILPSDHYIEDHAYFCEIMKQASLTAAKGHIITFGIKPTHPETGYGYLAITEKTQKPPYALDCFIEKPALQDAEQFIANGMHLWNAGIFMFNASIIIEAYKKHQPNLYQSVFNAYAAGSTDLNFFRPCSTHWASMTADSIDYAIMEKCDDLMVYPYHATWSDLGSWHAIKNIKPSDSQDNTLSPQATAIDCTNTLLHQTNDKQALVGIGLDNLVVVMTDDAVLVADQAHTQKVKDAVDTLKAKGLYQATQFLQVHRPWGWYRTLALGDQYQVKEIFVNPGASLSLQSHQFRSEHWVVVLGQGVVTIGEDQLTLSPNQSTYIPRGVKHRLSNQTNEPLMIIETQTGSYLGEDDIIRYEDDYKRVATES
jgi:mannose-1-phosphate guanylyltransferase/mannose-6-phosphate isomerase